VGLSLKNSSLHRDFADVDYSKGCDASLLAYNSSLVAQMGKGCTFNKSFVV
jgi:hypothetical protein